jgi:hypothetical protein
MTDERRRTERIRVSADGHYFVNADGTPFFWLMDWGYEIFKMPDRDQVERFLVDRARKGFTVLAAPITGITEPLTRPNRDGQLPYVDRDPLRPNEAYFANVDWIVGRAAHHGFRVGLFPSWSFPSWRETGTAGSGWTVVPSFTAETAEAYGRWLAQRYRDPGVFWVLGGDINPLWPSGITVDPLGNDHGGETDESSGIGDHRSIFDGYARGIQDGSEGAAFITYHPTGGSWPGTPEPRTSLYFGDRSWLGMNMIQSGHHVAPKLVEDAVGMDLVWNASFNYQPVNDEYNSLPARPIVDAEPRFENEAINLNRENGFWKAYDVRNATYHALFAGAAGVAYADVSTGMLAADLQLHVEMPFEESLDSPGSAQMQHAKALMLSRPYLTRIPDQSVVVGDAGRGEPYIGGTRDRDGGYLMVYLPHGQTVTIDPSSLAGDSAAVWWFDPRSGEAGRVEGVFPTSGPLTFSAPSRGAETDWILVVDDEGRGFPPPGAPR